MCVADGVKRKEPGGGPVATGTPGLPALQLGRASGFSVGVILGTYGENQY